MLKPSTTSTAVQSTLERVRRLCTNAAVFDFARTVISDSYAQCAPGHEQHVRGLVGAAFDRLAQASPDPLAFQAAVKSIQRDLLRTTDRRSTLGRIYHEYREQRKPALRFANLKPWITGRSVLDFGCGDGLTSAALSRHGYVCTLTDVLDYRHDRARSLAFVPLQRCTRLPFSDGSFGTALSLAVLHHLPPAHVEPVSAELRRVARRVIVEEDTYDVPPDAEGLEDALRRDRFLPHFMAMPADQQRSYLLLLDFFGNAVTQGLSQMNMPFGFRSVDGWRRLFRRTGFTTVRTIVKGFQRQTFNRTCHVWFILDP